MLVKTKLYIPHIRSCLVSRPKLAHKLNEGMSCKLTLVSAGSILQRDYSRASEYLELAEHYVPEIIA